MYVKGSCRDVYLYTPRMEAEQTKLGSDHHLYKIRQLQVQSHTAVKSTNTGLIFLDSWLVWIIVSFAHEKNVQKGATIDNDVLAGANISQQYYSTLDNSIIIATTTANSYHLLYIITNSHLFPFQYLHPISKPLSAPQTNPPILTQTTPYTPSASVSYSILTSH